MDSGHIDKSGALTAGAPPLELERYLPEVESEFDSDEQAMEFLGMIANIMCAFVDLGWGVDSLHFVIPELAKIPSDESEAS